MENKFAPGWVGLVPPPNPTVTIEWNNMDIEQPEKQTVCYVLDPKYKTIHIKTYFGEGMFADDLDYYCLSGSISDVKLWSYVKNAKFI